MKETPAPTAEAKGKAMSDDLLLGEPHETFWCPGCERMVDVDCGAHDDLPELCDDCAVHVWKVRESLLGAQASEELRA